MKHTLLALAFAAAALTGCRSTPTKSCPVPQDGKACVAPTKACCAKTK